MTEPSPTPRATPFAPADRGEPPPRRPFARLVSSPAVRRLAVGRLAAASVAALLLILGGGKAVQWAADWLRQRPERTLRFDQIVLAPPPPPWIKPGAAGLLKQVRRAAGLPETLPILGLDAARLAEDFQRESPWVRSVLGIYPAYPNRLTVRLEYRRPVAYIQLSDGQGRRHFDADGVALPDRELDPAACGRLVVFVPDPRAGTVAAAPGRHLRIAPPSPTDPGDPAPVQAAARLAALLVEGSSRLPGGTLAIHDRITRSDDHIFWVELGTPGRILMLRWGPPPGLEPPGEPDAAARWNALVRWLETSPAPTAKSPHYTLVQERGELTVQPIRH